ncbi:hypothetical protein GCM10010216_20970 [Streptomyces flaveolus]|nr:hypothetical protein GCM10010216_20970 [Streptomyces flaveolus]
MAAYHATRARPDPWRATAGATGHRQTCVPAVRLREEAKRGRTMQQWPEEPVADTKAAR